MTKPAPRRPQRSRPSGWPVGSFATYEQAQRAVDTLSDNEFPVENLSIIGVDLIEVEDVLGRLTWPKILLGGAASGAWIGLFFGLLLALFSPQLFGPIIWGLIMGAIFGVVMAAVSYAMTGGKRDFTSQTSIVAGRYDVICVPEHAPAARDMIANLGLAEHRGQAGHPENTAAAPRAGQPAGEQPQQQVQPDAHVGQHPEEPARSGTSEQGSTRLSRQNDEAPHPQDAAHDEAGDRPRTTEQPNPYGETGDNPSR